ncbi:uncharacterized protein LOC114364546 [Ostrinia furnacalis]|uniref:uncharacterized protein LOC114364546 n=1 Tax=Ostrinia furnacalis TaxID=93504 RepID=UPI001039E3C3|nr:uncharacterized protein LOC114364546 [Ostrinia furnacalis]
MANISLHLRTRYLHTKAAFIYFSKTFIGGIGHSLKPYEEGEDIACFLERMEQYFEANAMKEKKVASLLVSLHEDVYKTSKNVLHPDLPSRKTYKQIEEALKLRFKISHYRKVIEFDRLRQEDGENVATLKFVRHRERMEQYFEANAMKEKWHLYSSQRAITEWSTRYSRTQVATSTTRARSTTRAKDKDVYYIQCVHCGKSNHNISKCKYKSYKWKVRNA